MRPAGPSLGRPLARAAAVIALLCGLGAPFTARAADSAKAACVRSAEEGQRLRSQWKLREALARFTLCASVRCPAIVRNDCANWLSAVETALPTVVLRATAAEDPRHELYDVQVRVDGAPLTRKLDGGALPVNPGEHQVAFAAAGRRPLEEKVVVRVGEQHRLLAVALRSQDDDGTSGRSFGSRFGPAAWVLTIAGAAGLATAGTFGTLGWQQRRDLLTRCSPDCSPSEVDVVKRNLRIADIALVAGGAALVGAAALIWLAPPAEGTHVEVTPLAGGAMLTVGARLGGPRTW
jgi:hypothetical protein